MNITIKEKIYKTLTFSLFGKEWEFEGSVRSMKGVSEKDIKPIILRSIVGIDMDNSNSNILLFYVRSDKGSGYMSFKFAVEMDNSMKEIKRTNHLQDCVEMMTSYVFDNREKLNFNV